ncbi:MAG: Lrp/AsnC family transcriptional regulator [Thermoplasmata archaeon]
MTNVDESDQKIIDILVSNARTPFTEIANILDVSEGTVRKRVQRLESRGVIRGYTVDIDPGKLGYRCITLLGLDTEPENFLDAVHALAEFEEVRWAAKSTGDHMIMAEVWTKDDAGLSSFIEEKVCSIKGVKRICPAIILEKMRPCK